MRLGSKVSEARHTSNIGFGVFLQQDSRNGRVTGQLEDDHHIISSTFVPNGNHVTHRTLNGQEMVQLETKYRSLRGTTLSSFGANEIYVMEFRSDGASTTFQISRHGDESKFVHTSEQVQSLGNANRVLVFFRANHVLCTHLNTVIGNNCLGSNAPNWKLSLPEDSVPSWPLGLQTRMVTGSAEPFNVLNTALRHDLVSGGPGTSLAERPQAKVFADCIRARYPTAKSEPLGKVFPLMLNVDGLCLDLPFGLSMWNRGNIVGSAMAVNQLLKASIPVSSIGIVAFYPSQAKEYRHALQHLHNLTPNLGFDRVAIDDLEGWIGKEIGIAVVDLVRTANSSGNLGFLSQARRLKLALTLHR